MTTVVALVLYGLGMALLGGAIAAAFRGETIAVLREQLKIAREAEAVATDRLVHAWREDKSITIPPRPAEPVPPPDPLPSDLQAEVDQWESPESRLIVEQKIRVMLARGLAPPAILLALDNEHPPSPRPA